MYNKLLDRQIKRYERKHGSLPEGIHAFLETISNSYDHYERDRLLLERAMELSSQELSKSNNKLREEADEQKLVLAELSTEILRRKEIEKALVSAKEKAVEAAHIKSEFLANMSHEIRTPLNGVIGMTSILMDTPLTEEQEEFLAIIQSSGEGLLSIINDILDFSKLESKKMVLEHLPFNLRTCIEDALDVVTYTASSKGLELLYFIDKNVPEGIISDFNRLRQVIVNLLSNAVKFTAEGEVLVSVSSDYTFDNLHRIEIQIKDTGIGIPEDRIDSLFNAFSQVDASTSRKYGGTGLGLAISYELTTLLGGDLHVESTLGSGSTFHITLVVPSAELPDTKPKDRLRQKRVLIVDDNATNRRILSALTTSWEMEPVIVSSGVEVLTQINQGKQFDIALLDFQMPEMDGLTLAQTLSHHESASNLPLIMLSSIDERKKHHSEELFAHWLTKPIKPDHLYRVLADLIGEQTSV